MATGGMLLLQTGFSAFLVEIHSVDRLSVPRCNVHAISIRSV
jgi:hypothetical protein